MVKIENKHKVFQVNINKLSYLSSTLLDALTVNQIPYNWGIKGKGYYMMNVTNKLINNFQNTLDVTTMNYLFQICAMKGYSLIMIKF